MSHNVYRCVASVMYSTPELWLFQKIVVAVFVQVLHQTEGVMQSL